jgi:hypothetical protein
VRALCAAGLAAGVLTVAGCNATSERYRDEPVRQWPSQEVLRSLPDDTN